MGECPGVGGEDGHASTQVETGHESAQVIGPRRPAIDEDEVQVGAPPGDHQAWDAATAAQIDDRAGHPAEGVDERFAVAR